MKCVGMRVRDGREEKGVIAKWSNAREREAVRGKSEEDRRIAKGAGSSPVSDGVDRAGWRER